MNLYFCREYDDYSGLYILAESPAKAKMLFVGEVGTDYINIRYRTIKKDVGEYKQGVLQVGDEITLDSLGVKYDSEEEIL